MSPQGYAPLFLASLKSSIMPRKFFAKPEAAESDRVPPGQYLAKGFPVLTYGETPQIKTDDWLFKVWGLVEAKSFNWSDFLSN